MLLPLPQLVECFAVDFRAHLHLSVWLNKTAFSGIITVGIFGSPWSGPTKIGILAGPCARKHQICAFL